MSPLAGVRGALMVQGTTSDAGKSTLAAALCRLLARAGVRVAPFKPQNMALNSAVTVDGGEIGRAQALQAEAAGVEPHSDMNPVLLKPSSDTAAQVIVQGRVVGDMDAREFHAYKREVFPAVMESFARLQARHDVVVVEGAGSPAEVNLREGDIANMGFALAARIPVILVADIDRGGVFAHLVGTLECLAPAERELVRGFVINRFRGDPTLLQPGLAWLERRTGKPVLGVMPYLQGLDLDAEDAIARGPSPQNGDVRLRVVVPVFPRISNHTDFDALRAHPHVSVTYVGPGSAPPPADLVILPGSKNVRADLRWLLDGGWGEALHRHLRYGGKVIGICGGLQMLGSAIHDPHGLEGPAGTEAALGLLDFETTLEPAKRLARVEGRLRLERARVEGYEIHMGVSRGPALARPALDLEGRADGAISEDGSILGTYVHGLFDHPEACAALLRWAGLAGAQGVDRAELRRQALDRLADAAAQALDLAALAAAARLAPSARARARA